MKENKEYQKKLYALTEILTCDRQNDIAINITVLEEVITILFHTYTKDFEQSLDLHIESLRRMHKIIKDQND